MSYLRLKGNICRHNFPSRKPSQWRGLTPPLTIVDEVSEINIPLNVRKNKYFKECVRKYGEELAVKHIFPCAAELLYISLTSSRRAMHRAKKESFQFSYLPNEVDIEKGRVRLRGQVGERIRIFYSVLRSHSADIPVIMNRNKTDGRYADTKHDVFLFHKHIKELLVINELEITVGHRGVEMRKK